MNYKQALDRTTEVVGAIEMRGSKNPTVLSALEWLDDLDDMVSQFNGLKKMINDRFKASGWSAQHIKAIRTQLALSSDQLEIFDASTESLRLQAGIPYRSTTELAAAIERAAQGGEA